MSMSKAKILLAVAGAEAFIEDAQKVLAEIEGNNSRERWNPETGKYEAPDKAAPAPGYASSPGKASGTLRRRSMDLTRSLADMRKPN